MAYSPIQYVKISEDYAGQRIDNYLFTMLKGVPRQHVYRILRKGEVRVNKKRAQPGYRLQANDQLRIPPLEIKAPTEIHPPRHLFEILKSRILFEDANLLILNKPAGIAVHGGSNNAFGVIEILKYYLPREKSIELVHRLDRDTSGCLLIAKKRSILKTLHAHLREGKIKKVYLTLVMGKMTRTEVNSPLLKNQLQSGERMVRVSDAGQEALTYFKKVQEYNLATLMEASPYTGRTHQIRVHAASCGHPIAGDEKYGDKAFNKWMGKLGLKRLFLHASSLSFRLDEIDQDIEVAAPLEKELAEVLEQL